MQSHEPLRQQVVPSGDHRQPRAAGEVHARLRDAHDGDRHDDDRSDPRYQPEWLRPGFKHLCDRADQIHLLRPDEAEHGAGAKNEHRADDRRGDDDRPADRPSRIPALPRHDGRVLEAAKGPKSHLAEDVQVQQSECGQREREGADGRQRAHEVVRDRQSDERGEEHENQHTARVVHPFAKCKPTDRDEDEPGHDGARRGQNQRLVTRDPASLRSERIRQVCRHLQANLRGVDDRVDPDVPRHEEAGKLAESKLGPLIEASFERHQPVQVNDDDGAGHVEEDDGQQPEDDVRRAKSSRRANPAEPHDVEDLREHEIAQAELFLEGSAAAVDLGFGAIDGSRHVVSGVRSERRTEGTEATVTVTNGGTESTENERRRGNTCGVGNCSRARQRRALAAGGGSGSQATSRSLCLRSRTSAPACRATRGASRLLVPLAIRTSPFRPPLTPFLRL